MHTKLGKPIPEVQSVDGAGGRSEGGMMAGVKKVVVPAKMNFIGELILYYYGKMAVFFGLFTDIGFNLLNLWEMEEQGNFHNQTLLSGGSQLNSAGGIDGGNATEIADGTSTVSRDGK